MSSNPHRTSDTAPCKPSKWWLAVWITITALGVGSWVVLAMLSYYERGKPLGFGDNALINFLTLTPVLGALAVCTWVIRSAQYAIADNAERQAERRHTELMSTINRHRAEDEQRRWKQLAAQERAHLDVDGGSVTQMRQPRVRG
jgi:hypothetical protein